MKKIIIYTDGASRGNPGPAAAAFVIQDSDGIPLFQGKQTIGIATNNIAEYTAVLHSMEKLISDFSAFLPTQVEYRGDSQLIMSQLAGKYKIKNPELKKIYDLIKNLEVKVGQVSYNYTARANNLVADGLANEALDGK